MERLSFFLDWVPNCQFVGLIWARERGLYAAEGLDVHLVSPSEHPDTPVLDLVLAEPVSAGCMEDNLIARACLAGHPVRAIAATLQDTPMVLMTARDSGVSAPSDLPGKRVAMHRDGIHLLEAVLALNAIDANTVETTVGGWSLDDLVSGAFDAVQGYATTEPRLLARRGFRPRLVPVRHPDLHPYAQVMFAPMACIEHQADILRRFVRASIEGARAAMDSLEEAARIVAAVSDEHADPVENREILVAMQPLVMGADGSGRLGALDRHRWERNLAAYARFGIIERPAGYAEVVDPRFLE